MSLAVGHILAAPATARSCEAEDRVQASVTERCCVCLQSANLLLGHRDRRIVCKVAPPLSVRLIALADMADYNARFLQLFAFSACACVQSVHTAHL